MRSRRRTRRAVLQRVRLQAEAFAGQFADRLSSEQRELLEAYAAMDTLPFLERERSLLRHRFFHTGLLRNLARLLPW